MATTSTTARARRRILCLHGYRQTAETFRAKAGALRKALREVADLHFLEAPHEEAPGFTWWRASADGSEYSGYDESLALIRAHMSDSEPYDGVLGFSQGAVFASLIASFAATKRPEAPETHGLHFAVLISGFPSRARSHFNETWYKSINMPSLHVWGAKDELVPPAASRMLARRFRDAETLEHDGGHKLPAGDALRKIADFVGCGGVRRGVSSENARL